MAEVWLTAAGLWAAGILLLYEIGFPLPAAGALRALADTGPALLPLLSVKGFVGALGDLLGNLWAIAAFLFLQFSCLAAGARVCGWLGWPEREGAAGLFHALLLGWLAAGLAASALSLAGLCFPSLLAFLALLSAAGGGVSLRRLRAELALLGERAGGGSVLFRLARGAVLVHLALLAVRLLAPQTGKESLELGLALPARCLALHKLVPLAGNFAFDSPAHAEMMRTWGLALGGESCASLWGLAGLLAGGGMLALLLYRRAPAGLAAVCFALAATSPFLARLAVSGGNGLFLAPFVLGACVLLIPGGGIPVCGPRRKFLAGLLAGGAAALSLPALLGAVPVLAILAFGGTDMRRRLAGVASFLGGVLAACGPWFLKSAILWGNPFGPAGSGVPGISVFAGIAGFGSPWKVTFGSGLSPVWLAGAPLGLAVFRPRARHRAWWLIAVLAWVLWPALSPAGPVSVAALAILGAAIGLSAGEILAGRGRVRRAAAILAGAALALQLGRGALDSVASGALAAGLGLEARQNYFARAKRAYADALEQIGRRTPPGARILYVGELRSYPRLRNIVISSASEAPAFYSLIRASGTSAELARRMRQLGIDYVLHNPVAGSYARNPSGAFAWEPRDLGVWSAYWRQHARLITLPGKLDMEDGGYFLYRLGSRMILRKATPTLPGMGNWFRRIEELQREGKLQDVAGEIRILEGITGDFPEVMFFIGEFWAGQDPYKSWQYLRAADAGGFFHLSLWQDLAFLAEERWQLEEALVYHENIFRFEPRALGDKHRRVLLKLSRQARKLGRPARSERYLKRALELFPRDAALWAELSELMTARKRPIAADSALAKAVKLDPDNREYRAALRRLRR